MQELTRVSDGELLTMIATVAELTEEGRCNWREPAAIKPLLAGGATLIRPCSQAGNEPDTALFPACGTPDPALFQALVQA